jgi:hypothetical protein
MSAMKMRKGTDDFGRGRRGAWALAAGGAEAVAEAPAGAELIAGVEGGAPAADVGAEFEPAGDGRGGAMR